MKKARYRIVKDSDCLFPQYEVHVPMFFGFVWSGLRNGHNKPYGPSGSLEAAINLIKADLKHSMECEEDTKPKVIHDLSLERSEDGLKDLDSILEFNNQYPMNEEK